MDNKAEFNYLDIETEGRIELKVFDTIYYYDLRDCFGIMTKGKLLLVYEDESGKRVPLKTLRRKGMILGGHSYFSEDIVTENYYYIATEETEILRISPERSRELLLDRNFLFQCLKDNIKDSFSLTQELVYRLDKDIETFLAYILINYSEEGQMKIKNFSLFSEFIKCSRSNFYVALGKLVDRGIVEKDGRVITILDLDELKKLAKI